MLTSVAGMLTRSPWNVWYRF